MKQILMFLLVLILASACQAQTIPAAPTESLPVFRVALPVELAWMGDAFNACAQQIHTGILLVNAEQPSDVQIIWGAPPENKYAAQIGSEKFVIVVHPQNPLTSIEYSSCQAIFSGETRQWNADLLQAKPPAGEGIEVWSLASQDLLNQPLKPDAMSLADPAALRAAVASRPNAIGILPSAWVNSSVKALTLVDFPAEMTRPILAVMSAEPQAELRDWLVCLSTEVP